MIHARVASLDRWTPTFYSMVLEKSYSAAEGITVKSV